MDSALGQGDNFMREEEGGRMRDEGQRRGRAIDGKARYIGTSVITNLDEDGIYREISVVSIECVDW